MKKYGFFSRGTIHLNYVEEGQGIPVLVVGSARYYPRVFSHELCKYMRFVFMDHRGFSPSCKNLVQGEYELENIVEDMEGLRNHLELEKIILIGHSGHGYMALEYAKRFPERVSHLVLIGVGPDQSTQSLDAADCYFAEHASFERKVKLQSDLTALQAFLQNFPEKRFINFCLKLGARSWYDYTYDATALWEGVEVNMQIMDYLWGSVFRDIDILQNIEKLEMPVLLALGKYDFLVAPFYSWNPLLPYFKNVTVEIFEKSGHTPCLEEADLFNDVLRKWVFK